jgi:hypothetical protein
VAVAGRPPESGPAPADEAADSQTAAAPVAAPASAPLPRHLVDLPVPPRRDGPEWPAAADGSEASPAVEPVPSALADVPLPPRRSTAERGPDAIAAGRPSRAAELTALFVANTDRSGPESLFRLLDSTVPAADGAGRPEAARAVPPPPRRPDLRRESEGPDDEGLAAAVRDEAGDAADDAAEGETAGVAAAAEGEGEGVDAVIVPLGGDRLAELPLPRRRPLALAEAGTAPAVPRPAHKP